MKVWKVGATLSALTSCIALITQAELTSASAHSEANSSDIWSFESFELSWLEPYPDCATHNSCVFVVITETARCFKDVVVKFTISDEDDLFLGTQTQVINSRDFFSGQSYEIGTDSENVSYFAIDDVACGAGQDSTEHYI